MFKKIKGYFTKKKVAKKNLAYAKMLQSGAMFIQYIKNDMKKTSGKMNRGERRRFKSNFADGVITTEVVNHYADKIDKIIFFMENQKEIKARATKKVLNKNEKTI